MTMPWPGSSSGPMAALLTCIVECVRPHAGFGCHDAFGMARVHAVEKQAPAGTAQPLPYLDLS